MSLVGIVCIDDRINLVGSLRVVCLHRAYIVVAVRPVANKRTSSVDFQSDVTDDHQGAGYGLSASIVMLLS
jgi:hypothetical protein